MYGGPADSSTHHGKQKKRDSLATVALPQSEFGLLKRPLV
jgi:hypothetical protein